jgi:hypothetical protein
MSLHGSFLLITQAQWRGDRHPRLELLPAYTIHSHGVPIWVPTIMQPCINVQLAGGQGSRQDLVDKAVS